MSKPARSSGAAQNMTEDKLRDYLKRVVNDLRQTRRRLNEAEAKDHEPIAIIGMSCRFPGDVRSPEDLWQVVAEGRDAISAFPADRGWDLEALYDADPDRSGTSYVREGGFLYDTADFDPAFFGISPREALAMDPQQRLLLETSWEAFERAGIDPQSLRGSKAGVFVGSNYQDYATRLPEVPAELEGHLGIGNTPSVVSGRVAYTLGLEGPAVTVDTACSSSLVALHLACHALRQGDCSMALAGGISVMSSPASFIEFSRQRGLAPDARVKAFASGADGTALSEGIGMLLVERLSDARRNGHRVLAVIRGSAINQDGASNGLTAPNGPSQERVIRQALAAARLTPDQVDVVEAHGTGTKLGDPIEAQALIATYGQDRPADRPLWLGSVKSNIGHTQAAAGAASIIKMVMALDQGLLPRTLHVDEPSSRIDWEAGAVSLLTEDVQWPALDRPRRVGISSFGISGTNAHAVLEEAPPVEADEENEEQDDATPAGVVPWVISARTAEALRAQARQLREYVDQRPDLDTAEVAHALATTRSAFEHRAVALGGSTGELLKALDALAHGEPSPHVVQGVAPDETGKTVFVFPGQGTQWPGMGAELLDSVPVFAESMARCEEALAPYVDWSLTEVLRSGAELDRVDVIQPVTWAVMVSLAATWQELGVRPDAVVGHSQGEIAAAAVAGALSLEDAAKVVAVRARIIGEHLAGLGTMASIPQPSRVIEERLPSGVGIAAINGPHTTVVSGDKDAVETLVADLQGQDIRARLIPVDYASHSAHVEAIEAQLADALAGIQPRPADIPFFSTVEPSFLNTEALDAGYWYRNLRQTVHFHTAIQQLTEAGHTTYIESSAHPVLTYSIEETEGAQTITGTLRRGEGTLTRLLTSAAHLHTHGHPVNWPISRGSRHIDLPTYPFQHQRYWIDVPDTTAAHAPVPATDIVDTRFWEAVENEDWESLADTLAVPDGASLSTVLPALASWRQERRREATVNDWRYGISWKPVADGGATTRLGGTWLVVVPEGRATDDVVRTATEGLARHGAQVVPLELNASGAARGTYVDLIGEKLSAQDSPLAGVLSFLALDESVHPAHPAMTAGVAGTLALVQALGDARLEVPVWFGTCGAVAVGASDAVTSPAQAQVWGLGRVVALEQPERWGGLVDLPGELDDRARARLCAVLAGLAGEDQVAVRSSGVFARRLVRNPLDVRTPGQAAPGWRTSGTALVTGGTGALGPHIARWLASNGAEHVVLTSRRGPSAPGMAELATELAAEGVRLTVAACDAADREALAGVLEQLKADGESLRTVVHAAAFIELASLAESGLDEFADVLAAKVAGAAHLDELLGGDDLDAFVLFSSIAGVWGSGDHGAYAAANAYLDALAEQRRARGLKASSIAWGVWNVWDPERLPEGVKPEQLQARGLPFLDPDTAFAAMRQILAHDETFVAVAEVDWERFVPVFTSAGPRPLLAGVPEAQREIEAATSSPGTASGADAPSAPSSPLRDRLEGLAAEERDRVLLELVRDQAASVLGHASAEAVEPGRAFRDLGFDSLTAVELRNRLNTATGLRLPATLVFDYPSPGVLAAHLRDEFFGALPDTAPAGTAAARPTLPGADDDPIVIIGMGCRFPGGVRSPEELWELLLRGGDVISGLPTDRGWDLDALYDPDPEQRGKSYTRHGGFLYDAADFDPAFFGISPREALAMDPQQRLLLETSWEAFERAGINPQSLRGSRTSVFAGVSYHDYGSRLGETPEEIEGYLGTGNTASIASGRVSYVLGLEGAAVTLDTGCSSSLVALHLAAQSLRQGESTLALAGGVSVMAVPTSFTEFSRQRGLSVDGRCRAFSADADGMGMSEGVGMLLLERLSNARRNGHRVLAVVRGTAMNQDGASNGLTAPNGPSQQRVIRQALANAGLAPDQVDAVEAHGTGTKLGDPIEAQALIATYGQDRPADRPLWLGSVKSNIGHTQAASGVAGLIKMVMALQHGVLPKTLHVGEPTPKVDWSAGAVALLTEETAWPSTGQPRRAGVSSFGISGTNTHAVLEQAPDDEPVSVSESPGVVPWVISARTADALRDQARQLREYVDQRPELDTAAVADTLIGRALFEHRSVVLAEAPDAVAAALDALAGGQPHTHLVQGQAKAVGKTVFVFPGQGTQWAGMGAELLHISPVFAESIARCEEALAPYVDWSLTEVLRSGAELDRVDVIQPVTWAVMVSLAATWQELGVRPDAVVGHSQGEIAAAAVAGALSLEDAAKVVAVRARIIGEHLAGLGTMASIPQPSRVIEERLPSGVGIAAINGPHTTVVSGDKDAVETLVADLQGQDIRARLIPVDYASHSAHVEAIEAQLADALAGIQPRPADIPFFSTVEPSFLNTEALDAGYWYRNLRQTVHFHTAIQQLTEAGHTTYIESSAHPVLTYSIEETEGAQTITGTLRRGEGTLTRLLTSAAHLHTHGHPINWPITGGNHATDLPTYPFQHQRYWINPTTDSRTNLSGAGLAAAGHPLLGAAVEVAGTDTHLFTGRLSLQSHPWLADHAVSGTVLLPGTGFLELALQAGHHTDCGTVEELTLEAPLILPERGGVDVQLNVGAPDDSGRRDLTLHSRAQDAASDEPWTRHATGTLAPVEQSPRPDADITTWPPSGAEPVETEGYYDRLAEQGYGYGPAFHGLRTAWRRGDEVFAEVALPEEESAEATEYGIHPALMDAALHALGLGLLPAAGEGRARLPFSWGGVTLHAAGAAALRVRVAPLGDAEDTVSVTVADPAGMPVATAESLVVRPVVTAQLEAAGSSMNDSLFRMDWVPASAGLPPVAARRWAVVGPDPLRVGRTLEETGATVFAADDLDSVATLDVVPDVVVVPYAPQQDGTDKLAARVHEVLYGVLDLVKRWLAEERFADSRLVLLTRNAVATSPEDTPDLEHAAICGLIRSAQSEHPDRLVLIDTDNHTHDLTGALTTGEPQVAIRNGKYLVPRLARTTLAPARESAPVFRPDSTVLITGATGTLAGLLAHHLVTHHHVQNLVLLSRRPAHTLATTLNELGAHTTVVTGDVTDPDTLTHTLTHHPITAVIHTAATLHDATLDTLTTHHLDTVLKPKLDGALLLHELTTQHTPHLDAFILFSSAAATFGGPGQAAYAAANTFLDTLAHHRHTHGQPALSLGWGLWEDRSTMTGNLTHTDLHRMTRHGVGAMSSDEALRLLDAACAAGEPHLLPIRLDVGALRRRADDDSLPALLRGLAQRRVRRHTAEAGMRRPAELSLAERLARVSGEQRAQALEDLVVAQVAAVLGHASTAAIEPDRTFKDIGFDSLTAVELRNRLNTATGLRLPATLVFDQPTPQAIARFVERKLFPQETAQTTPAPAVAPDSGHETDAIDAIDEMDVDLLINLAFDGDSAGSDAERE